jgi:hypothetical protein
MTFNLHDPNGLLGYIIGVARFEEAAGDPARWRPLPPAPAGYGRDSLDNLPVMEHGRRL